MPARTHNGAPVRDVVVIGAGMCGLAALARLQLSGINNAVAYDAAPVGHEGTRVTFARMETLRSPKYSAWTGLGLAQLTFRAWFTAQWGFAAIAPHIRSWADGRYQPAVPPVGADASRIPGFSRRAAPSPGAASAF